MESDVEKVYERVLASPGVVFLLGGLNTGKSTFGIELLRRANQAGMAAALVDADIEQSTVGPPTTVGLKLISGMEEIGRETLRTADALAFVGSLNPREHLLPLVSGTTKLVGRAREAGCSLIVVDSTGFVAGVYGQTLKFFKMDAVKPDFVVAFERGGELEHLVGMAQRFTPAEVIELEAPGEFEGRSAEERVAFREEQFAAYFAAGSSRWRVKPTVFMPTLPPEFDLSRLDSLVVGMEDGKGSCPGIGVLEYDTGEGILRMVSPITEGVRGLRLGSVKIDIDGRSKGPVTLRQLLGTE
ncbi:MAG: Clp1/GlmU family protein [Actinomycetota bacterium]